MTENSLSVEGETCPLFSKRRSPSATSVYLRARTGVHQARATRTSLTLKSSRPLARRLVLFVPFSRASVEAPVCSMTYFTWDLEAVILVWDWHETPHTHTSKHKTHQEVDESGQYGIKYVDVNKSNILYLFLHISWWKRFSLNLSLWGSGWKGHRGFVC